MTGIRKNGYFKIVLFFMYLKTAENKWRFLDASILSFLQFI